MKVLGDNIQRDEAKRNRADEQKMVLCSMHEAMLFSAQNIH